MQKNIHDALSASAVKTTSVHALHLNSALTRYTDKGGRKAAFALEAAYEECTILGDANSPEHVRERKTSTIDRRQFSRGKAANHGSAARRFVPVSSWSSGSDAGWQSSREAKDFRGTIKLMREARSIENAMAAVRGLHQGQRSFSPHKQAGPYDHNPQRSKSHYIYPYRKGTVHT